MTANCESCGFVGRTYREYGTTYSVGSIKCLKCAVASGKKIGSDGRPEWMVEAVTMNSKVAEYHNHCYSHTMIDDHRYKLWRAAPENA